MDRLKRDLDLSQNRIALFIFIVVTLIYLRPIFCNFSYWGITDWDQALSYAETTRKTVLRYHQIPLWTPYYAGGSALFSTWAQNLSISSPFFVFVLLFGAVYGLKIQATAYFIIGMVGMFLLSKQLNLKRYSSYLPPFIFWLSSFFALHFTIGHYGYWEFCWLPYVFLYYLKCLRSFKIKYLLLSSFFLSLMVIGGIPYPALFTILFLFLYSLLQRKLEALRTLFLVLIITCLLGAIKLLPGLELQKEFPRIVDLESQRTEYRIDRPFLTLWGSLLHRRQVISDERTFRGKDLLAKDIKWSEQGTYVGIISLLLFLIGLGIYSKKYMELIIIGLVFLLLSLGSYSPINLWRPLHSLPIFNNMINPSRFRIMFIFVLALLSGVVLSRVEEIKDKVGSIRIKQWIEKAILCIVLLVVVDLIMVNSRIFKNAFIIPPMKTRDSGEFYQTFSTLEYRKQYTNFVVKEFYDIYPFILGNKGVINVYDPTPGPQNVLPKTSPFYRGESFFLNNKGSSTITYFSPNTVKVRVNTLEDDILVLNQNYDNGWRVKGAKNNKVISTKGLVSVAVTPQDYLITFYYLPTSFLVGALISLSAVIIIILYRFEKVNKRHFRYSLAFLFVIFFLYLLLGIRYFAGASPENRPLILAKKYQWDGKYNQAVEEWEKVIQTYPYYVQGYNSLGYCYLKKKEYNKAIKTLKQAIALQSIGWNNYHFLGACYYEKKEHDKAIEALKKAIQCKVDEWSNYHLLGACYYENEEYDKAIEAFKQAVMFKSDEWSNYYNLGRIYLEIGAYDKAIQAYEKALALVPETEYISRIGEDLDIIRLLERETAFNHDNRR